MTTRSRTDEQRRFKADAVAAQERAASWMRRFHLLAIPLMSVLLVLAPEALAAGAESGLWQAWMIAAPVAAVAYAIGRIWIGTHSPKVRCSCCGTALNRQEVRRLLRGGACPVCACTLVPD